MMSKIDKAYDKWLESCIKKFNKKFNDKRKYTSNPDNQYHHSDVVEFDDDGNAYVFTPEEGTKQIPKAVTPWVESKQYKSFNEGSIW